MASPSEMARAAILGIPYQPAKKPDPVGVVKAIEALDAKTIATTAGAIIRNSLASLNAVTTPPASQMAWVLGDATAANNGVYQNTGTSGSPVWTRRGDLPYSVIHMINVGAGTPDAIVATSSLPAPVAPGAALFTLNIVADNTGPVTLNGKPLRTNSGNEIAPGGLTAGSIHAFLDLGDHFRLLSDQASAAIVAAAEAYANAALSAVPNAFPADRDELKALDTTTITAAYLTEPGRKGQFIWRTGDFSAEVAADTAEGIYVAPNSDPTGASGAWVRVYTGPAVFDWFGAIGDGVADDTIAMNAAWAVSKLLTGVSGKVYRFTSPVGSTSSLPGRELIGERSMTLLWSGADASLHFCGEGWRLENWNIRAEGVVNEGISMGVAGDNRGSSVSGNVFFSGVDSYFATFLATTNWWYSRFCNNVMYNSASNEVRRGDCITGNYSVNNDISGNCILRFSNAIVWSDVPRPGVGHVCEGWMISQNTLAANNTHFLALAGLLPTLNANIIDMSSSSANPIISDADCTVITSNWIDCPEPVLLRNSARHIVANNVFVGSDNQHLAFQNVAVAQVSGNSFAFGSQAISAASAGCSGLNIVGNSFAAFTLRAADISLAENSIWQHNTLSDGTAEPLLGGNFDPQYRQYHATVVKTLGTGTSEPVDFALPSGIFVAKPSVVQVAAAGQPLIGNYDFDDPASTATSVRVTISRLDGTALPGVPVRFSLSAFA